MLSLARSFIGWAPLSMLVTGATRPARSDAAELQPANASEQNLVKQLSNPIASLISVPFQNNSWQTIVPFHKQWSLALYYSVESHFGTEFLSARHARKSHG
jgi:hypothetical protein